MYVGIWIKILRYINQMKLMIYAEVYDYERKNKETSWDCVKTESLVLLSGPKKFHENVVRREVFEMRI